MSTPPLRGPWALVCSAMLMLPGTAACAQVPAAGRGAAPAAGVTRGTVTAAGVARDYALYVPDGAATNGPSPLVMMLHGCTQDADDAMRGTRWNQWADAHGALVLYPEQSPSHNPQRCWNWYDPEHQAGPAGEPAVLLAMLDTVARAHNVDAGRVHLAGISAGGAMALVLAVAQPARFASVAVHSAIPFGAARSVPEALAAMRGRRAPAALPDQLPDLLPPLMVIQGGRDAVVDPGNRAFLVAQWLGKGFAGTAVNETVHVGEAGYVRRDHRAAGAVRVVDIYVPGLGHAWSGGSPAGTYTDPAGPDATAIIGEFFAQGRRTRLP